VSTVDKTPEVDLLVHGGRLVDGTGNPWRHADVTVTGGRIAAVLPPGTFTGTAAEEIDAEGHVVAPGFIDIHSHSDLALIVHPEAEQKLRQGVTTEVVGNCGISVAPVTEAFRQDSQQYARPVLGFTDLEWNWSDVDSYLDRVQEAAPAVNVATYVGLGSIRCAVMGFDAAPPTADQRRRMVELTREALAQGAVGLSSGLVYAPGSYSSHEEIIELVSEAARVGALYSSHMRDQGDGFLDSIAETLDVGRRTGAPVQVAHHKVAGARNWGTVTKSLAMIRHARQQGVDAGSDVYPYLAGSTTMTALLPGWALAGGKEAMLARLREPQARRRIKKDWTDGLPQWDNRVGSLGWDNIYINHLETAKNQELVGLSVSAAAQARSQAHSPGDFLLDLLEAENGNVGNIQVACAEDDLRQVMQDPTTCFGSDGLFSGGRPHPRLHGTFPRILGEYVRNAGLLTLEEAIRKMTSHTARRLGIAGVGLVEVGYNADLVVFDPETVDGPASYEQPTLPPRGVRDVIVSGEIALRAGRPTGTRTGRVLRRDHAATPQDPDTKRHNKKEKQP
jgi:N-acyl-D-aspartate/D-glutamate deacylase